MILRMKNLKRQELISSKDMYLGISEVKKKSEREWQNSRLRLTRGEEKAKKTADR